MPASTTASPGWRWQRWSVRGALLRGALAGLAVVVVWEILWVLFLGNVRTVIPGQVYRCSQPSAELVKRLVDRYGIRTIVNLRGYGEGNDWYEEEQRAAAKLGVSVEDLSFSANRLPSTRELRHLIEVLDRSERPILLHCYRGVDRTGLASVISLLLYTDVPLAEALGQLSLRYLHLPFGRTGHLDRFFRLYTAWLQQQQMTHSPQNFRDWVHNQYTAGPCSCRLELAEGPVTGSADPRRTAPTIGRSDELPPPAERMTYVQRLPIPVDRPFSLRIRAHNTSTETWHFDANLNKGIHGVCQVVHNHVRIGFGRVGAFRVDVRPGEYLDLCVPVPSLPGPGTYRLQMGLYEENNGFFHEQGADPLELDLEAP